MNDPFELNRFVEAQAPDLRGALAELRQGKKVGHWMWFVFPQVDGLGHSSTARRFSIKSAAEARAYLAHPVLGPRLVECTRALLGIDDKSAEEILGSPDWMKFRSSMTLFDAVGDDETVFRDALETFFGGDTDPRTLDFLRSS